MRPDYAGSPAACQRRASRGRRPGGNRGSVRASGPVAELESAHETQARDRGAPHDLPGHRTLPQRLAAGIADPRDLLGGMRQPARQACGIRPRRPRSGSRREFPAFFRPEAIPDRACSTSAAAGRSRPHASLVDNTTWDLVADMERLRELLGIKRWLVFGGSWGSTLALAYAQSHPARVTELVLRGIFMLRKWEIDWFYQDGAGAIYPGPLAGLHRRDPAARARRPGRRVLPQAHEPEPRDAGAEPRAPGRSGRPPPVSCMSTSRTSRTGARRTSRSPSRASSATTSSTRVSCVARTSCCADVNRIRHIPTVIVQGRYDIVCPIRTAWDLHTRWPEAAFRVVPDAGHSALEPGNTHELVSATDRFARARAKPAAAPRGRRGRGRAPRAG